MLEQAKKNLESFDAVGIQEDLPSSILLLCYRLGIPLLNASLPKINVTAHRRKVTELSAAERGAILERNAFDCDLYKCAKSLFKSQLVEMIASVGESEYQMALEQLSGRAEGG
jgi:hypothetical protein